MKRCVRLSPAGLAAVSIWRLYDAEARWPGHLERSSGESLPWPRDQQVRHALLIGGEGPVDEVLAVGGDGWVELHIHGGVGVQLALDEFLAAHGWVTGQEPVSAPLCLRAARARASARWGLLAGLDKAVAEVLAQQGPDDSSLRRDLAGRLRRSLDLAEHGRRLQTPALVRLVGQPNAGKSTLFNALLSDQRALVSPHPGTTRDSVRASLSVAGVPILLEDTAGQAEDGLRAAGSRDPRPDLVIHLLREAGENQLSGPGVLVIQGQADQQPPGELPAVSGRTGAGLGELLASIGEALGIMTNPSVDVYSPTDPEVLTRFWQALDLLRAD